MRWERLLADIEAAEAARNRAEMLGEAAERARAEMASVTLEARLRAAVGRALALEMDGPQRCTGIVEAVGAGWLTLAEPAARWVVATNHLVWVEDLPSLAAPEPADAVRRVYEGLGMRHVLRGLAADRAAVRIGLGTADACTGTIDRVGADWIDVAAHAVGEPRRARDVRTRRTVRIGAIRFLRVS